MKTYRDVVKEVCRRLGLEHRASRILMEADSEFPSAVADTKGGIPDDQFEGIVMMLMEMSVNFGTYDTSSIDESLKNHTSKN